MADLAGATPILDGALIQQSKLKKSGSKVPNALGLAGFVTLLFYLAVAVLIYFGWQHRFERYLTAESGLGYAMGIIGGLLMLLLLLYPLRKKVRFMQGLGPVKYWFRMHMVFGVLGPLLILYHANFKLGSLNASVAMICMLVVAGSGLIGRYFYIKIHYGLYGNRATLQKLKLDAAKTKEQLLSVTTVAPELLARFESFEQIVSAPSGNVLFSAGRVLVMGIRTRLTQQALLRSVRKALKQAGQNKGWNSHKKRQIYKTSRRLILTHLANVRRVSEFSFFERMFSLWHVFHFPLFLMLVISGVIHVLAVHMY